MDLKIITPVDSEVLARNGFVWHRDNGLWWMELYHPRTLRPKYFACIGMSMRDATYVGELKFGDEENQCVSLKGAGRDAIMADAEKRIRDMETSK